MLNNIIRESIKFINIKIFNALMIWELCSYIVSVTYLTSYWHVWAFCLDMLVKLSSGQILEFFSITNITTKFWTMELSMDLKFSKSFPDNFSFSIHMTSVWELTEINTILKNFVDWLKEFSSFLAIWTARIIISLRSYDFLSSSAISSSRDQFFLDLLSDMFVNIFIMLKCINVTDTFDITNGSLSNLNLAIFTEKLVTFSTLLGFIWELKANDALDFFNHFSLKFILNFIHLNI